MESLNGCKASALSHEPTRTVPESEAAVAAVVAAVVGAAVVAAVVAWVVAGVVGASVVAWAAGAVAGTCVEATGVGTVVAVEVAVWQATKTIAEIIITDKTTNSLFIAPLLHYICQFH